ncbi:lipid-A-disaccharide synthase [Oceaniglobus indicus]|uniref:lipid-A-disaccharide synthase n=1 Tax=Oceaniglobus indicus TaxID=2047749 RepID=UPI001F4EE1B3|nr:lipid-A-disaccharide synthase [Oceaniglobus indicus]
MNAFVIAGEPSGDRLAAALMGGLRRLHPAVDFEGVGGPLMQAEGLESLFPMEELSVMGLAEVLPKYRHLRRRMIQTADAVLAARPDVLITVDSPDFCLRVAQRVRARSDIRIVHYVAPSVWAWRPGRASAMARHVDQVLALLPFEPPYMEAAGMRCDFVGHPVVAEPAIEGAAIRGLRDTLGLGDAPVVLILPGSRKGEVTRLLPIFGAAVARVVAARPDTRVLVPAAAPVADLVAAGVAGWPGNPVVLDPRGPSPAEGTMRKRQAFAAADVALAASGTVSLELAAAGTPMVIAYDMNRLTWAILRRMVRVDTVTLVNLVSDSRAVPEFLGPACLPGPISDALLDLLADPSRQCDALSATMERLGRGGEDPGLRAARAVLDGLQAGPG